MEEFARSVLLGKRSAEELGELITKLSGEGVQEPSDLAGASREAVIMRLASHAAFTIADVADCARLHDFHSSVRESPAAVAVKRERSRSARRRSCSQSRRRRCRATPYRFSGGRAHGQQHCEKTKPVLWDAVERGDIDTVTRLLNAGHDPREKFQGWTPLMKAAEEDYVEIADLLLNTKGVDIEGTNNKGRAALSFAAAPSNRGRERRNTACRVLHLLLNHGASFEHRDASKRTARERAVEEKRKEAIAIIDCFEPTRALGSTAVAC